jgi:F0F1-type ATP synthase assembly protein I
MVRNRISSEEKFILARQKGLKALFVYSTIGLQLALTILVFIYIGHKLDQHYRTSPWFVVAGTAIGMGAGFYNLIRGLASIDSVSSEEGENATKRRKWL